MIGTARAYRKAEYLESDVMNASPIRLVIMAYDRAIKACEKEDFTHASQAVSLLRDSLDFDYGNIAVSLFGLYQWCLDCIRSEEYKPALITLRSLREVWIQVEKSVILAPTDMTQIQTENFVSTT